jgi:hypothetical protein
VVTVNLIPCRQSRQQCSIISLPSSQVEAAKVEIFLSSQGSRKVNVERSSIAYSFLVRAHNLQMLRIEQGHKPRIDRSFCYASLCCYREHRVLYTKPSRSPPHHGQFFRPLDLICVSVTTMRHRDATSPSSSATILMMLRPHGLTIVELRVAYTRYPVG